MQSLSKVQIKASQEIQGCTKITFPGCVKLDEKVAFVLLRQAGEHNLFTYSHNQGSPVLVIITVELLTELTRTTGICTSRLAAWRPITRKNICHFGQYP